MNNATVLSLQHSVKGTCRRSDVLFFSYRETLYALVEEFAMGYKGRQP